MKAEYVEHMGSDLSVVNAARVSFDKQSEWQKDTFNWENLSTTQREALDADRMAHLNLQRMQYTKLHLSEADTKLITYLAKHNHWTPFAHPQITLRMSAPVPIRTQCFKHKQGFVENEESRRYISGVPELYTPMWRKAAANVKQGSAEEFDVEKQGLLDEWYGKATAEAFQTYKEMLSVGVCPEQARFILPQGCLVNWMWTGSLAAYARFYKQRTDPHAQKEVQMLAEKVGEIIEPLFPVSWRALTASEEKALTDGR